MSRPIAIDLFCGMFGWSEGLIAEGWRVIGFDIEDMCGQFGLSHPDHCQLVLQDVITLFGGQFRSADLIVASPPCQEPSYRSMPWSRAKALNAIGPPHKFIELFNACFILQQQASEAAGRYIPLVVENVKGAQPWVGSARYHYGSFYLWGDVPALMPRAFRHAKVPGLNWSGSEKPGYVAKGFNVTAAQSIKNNGGSWFNEAHNTTSGKGQNPVNGNKGTGGSWFTPNGGDREKPGHWKESGCVTRTYNSKDPRRKAAAALIAKIPFELSSHIARTFKPRQNIQNCALKPLHR